jgi:hypothetical protein
MQRTRTQTPTLWKWLERYYLEKKGVLGEIVRERYVRSDDQAPTNHAKLLQLLQLAEGILNGCKREALLRNTGIYVNLLGCTVLNMPRHREDFILENTEELLRYQTDLNCTAQMKLYKLAVEIYEEKKDFDAAYQIITEAEKVAKRFQRNLLKWFQRNFVYAQYYDLLSGFYDAKLNGAYEPGDPREKECLGKLIEATDKTIYYAKKSGFIGKQILTKNLLGKATILIRSYPEEKEQINKLLVSAMEIVITETQPYAKVRWINYLVWAWYFTLVSPYYKGAVEFMQKARDISSQTSETDLDNIDNMIIPCANILLEWEQFEASAELIVEGIQLCEKYESVIPYVRKKMDLYGCYLDVYYQAHNFERCRAIIEEIDHENALHKELGIVKNISDKIRNEAYNA